MYILVSFSAFGTEDQGFKSSPGFANIFICIAQTIFAKVNSTWVWSRSQTWNFLLGYAGGNPTIASNNASAVKIYSSSNSPVRFENENVFFYFNKRFILIQRWHCSCKFISHRIGSLWETDFSILIFEKNLSNVWLMESFQMYIVWLSHYRQLFFEKKRTECYVLRWY
jgi:hypothetical protein